MTQLSVSHSPAHGHRPMEPAGDPYDWFQRAGHLMETGNPDAAAQLLERVLDAEPRSQAALEFLARARFDARRYQESAVAFDELLASAPDNDYAHFGRGLCAWHLQQFETARDHLALAFVMRPERPEYSKALAQVKATIRARSDGHLPLNGPVNS